MMDNYHFWQTLTVGIIIGLLIGIAGKEIWPAELPADVRRVGCVETTTIRLPDGRLWTHNDYIGCLPIYQQVAWKAITGKFGQLQTWKEQGYRKLLTVTPMKKLAWITVYNEHDKGCNRWTASGREVSHRVAAMVDKPWGTWVLVDLPEGYQLRQVFDTGSRRNIWRAQNPPRKNGRLTRRPAETWVDLYYSPAAMKTLKNGRNQSWVRSIYVF